MYVLAVPDKKALWGRLSRLVLGTDFPPSGKSTHQQPGYKHTPFTVPLAVHASFLFLGEAFLPLLQQGVHSENPLHIRPYYDFLPCGGHLGYGQHP